MNFVHVELKRETWFKPERKIESPDDAVAAVQEMIENLDREIVVCIHVATNGRVINASICSVGTMAQALISPAEVLRTALLSGACKLLMIHNHPSGNCKPSNEDLQVAKQMATACDLMGIKLLDFIIIGAYGYLHSVNQEEGAWLQPSYKWISNDMITE